ncbi:MAG: glycosyltransferase family 2 protein, partial [Chitinophagales bacterium]
ILHYASQITDNFEIILVEDGSKDDSWTAIRRNCGQDARVKGIKLSRNFGQHSAITAALAEAQGEYVMMMDCDLQDNPAYIPELYKLATTGEHDIVFTHKVKRNHSLFRNVASALYDWVYIQLEDQQPFFKRHIGNYTVLNRKVVDAFLRFNDYERHYLMVLRWLGFRYTFFEVEHNERFEGESSYTFSKLVQLAITGITANSTKLMDAITMLGSIFTGFSILSSWVMMIWLFMGHYIPFHFWLLWSMFFCTGLILLAIGILGIYIGKTFQQTKNRPLYLIEERINSVTRDF